MIGIPSMSDGGKNHDEICGDDGAEVFALDLESVPEALVEIPSKINEVDIEFASSVNRMVTKNLET